VAQRTNPQHTTKEEQQKVGFPTLSVEAMTTASRVISIRLPSGLAAALERSATQARLSVAETLDWLLRNSVGNFELLRGLADCPEYRDAKLDARISIATLAQIRITTAQTVGLSLLQISKSLWQSPSRRLR